MYFFYRRQTMVKLNFIKRMLKNTKGQALGLGNLLPTVVVFAVVILATSLITGVVQDVRNGQTVNTAAANVSDRGLTGLLNLSGQFGNIGTIIAIVVIIGLLVGAFVAFQRNG